MKTVGRHPSVILLVALSVTWPGIADAQFLRGFDLFREGRYCEAQIGRAHV